VPRGSYKSPPWPGYELDSIANVDRFTRDVIKAIWTGRLGTRQASAINGSIRLLMELRGWIRKAPLQVIQAQAVVRPNVKKLLDELDEDEQEVLAKALRRLEGRA